jgi:flagellar motor protein MotB
MKVDLGEIPCAGFGDQQFDFPALHQQLSQPIRDLLEVVIEEAVTAESDPLAGRFCSIVIAGHADRNDVPGISAEERRANELQFSSLRAESAQAFLFAQLVSRLQDGGFPAPQNLALMQNVDMTTIACGSADLIHLTPSSDQRPQNRRVQISATMFTPNQ